MLTNLKTNYSAKSNILFDIARETIESDFFIDQLLVNIDKILHIFISITVK